MENGGVLTADYRRAESRGSGKECVAPGGYDTESPPRAPCAVIRPPGDEGIEALKGGRVVQRGGVVRGGGRASDGRGRARPLRGECRVLCCVRPLHNVRQCPVVIAPKCGNSGSWVAIAFSCMQNMLRHHAVIRASVQHKMAA
jgi:hypothetical protein